MGTDKAFLVLDGRTLLARMLEIAQSVSASVRVVGERSKYESFAPVVEDVFPGCGPLAGIHAALRFSTTDLNLILAVDTPFVSAALLDYVLLRARNSTTIAILPRAGGGLQPLCAVYRREFSNFAERALAAGQYKIDRLFDQASVLIIPQEELERAGFDAALFRNLNTSSDVASLHNRAEAGDLHLP